MGPTLGPSVRSLRSCAWSSGKVHLGQVPTPDQPPPGEGVLHFPRQRPLATTQKGEEWGGQRQLPTILCFIRGKCSHLVKMKFAQQEARKWELAFLAGREEPLEDTNSIMNDLNGFVS